MQLEIQGIPKSIKSKYTLRLKNSQSELLRWKKLSREVHGKVQRGELFAGSGGRFGGVTSDEPYGTADDRTRLLVGHEVLEDGTRLVHLIAVTRLCFFIFSPFCLSSLIRSFPSLAV
jgi:vesicle transport through interaction with t-SNAREs 1